MSTLDAALVKILRSGGEAPVGRRPGMVPARYALALARLGEATVGRRWTYRPIRVLDAAVWLPWWTRWVRLTPSGSWTARTMRGGR